MVRSRRDARGCAVWCALASWLLAPACQRVGPLPDTADDAGNDDGQVPFGTTSTGEVSTTYDGPVPCMRTEDCAPDHCVAPYLADAGMGDAVCVPECVPADALDRWCIDDASCCASLQCDAIDGLCRAAGDTDATTGGWGSSSGGSSSGSSGTGSGSGSSSGA